MELKERYEACCNEYVQLFADKQGIEFDYWIGDIVGGLASFGEEYYFQMDVIVYDITNECEPGLILKWQNDTMEYNDTNIPPINYRAYAMGYRYE